MGRNATWTNEDGLVVGFGAHESDEGGQNFGGKGPVNVHIYKIEDATNLASAVAASDGKPATIPAGAVVTSAKLYVRTAFTSGGAATLDLEFMKLGGTTYGANGIDAAIALTAIDAEGDIVSCDGADVSTPVAPLSEAVWVTANYNTAAFTAGAADLVIEYVL